MHGHSGRGGQSSRTKGRIQGAASFKGLLSKATWSSPLVDPGVSEFFHGAVQGQGQKQRGGLGHRNMQIKGLEQLLGVLVHSY